MESAPARLQRGRWTCHHEHARQSWIWTCQLQTQGRNWPSTLLWCQSSVATEQSDPEPPMRMASSWLSRGRGRSGPIPSWWAPVPEHGLWFWLAKLQAGRLKKPGHLPASSRRLEGGMSRQSSERGRNKHGVRWMSILGCSAAKAFASSLLNLKAGGADGETPNSHDVMGDFRMSEIDMV